MSVGKIKEIAVTTVLCGGLAFFLYAVSSLLGGSKLNFTDYALVVGLAYWWQRAETEKENKREKTTERLHERLLKVEDAVQFIMNKPSPPKYDRDEY